MRSGRDVPKRAEAGYTGAETEAAREEALMEFAWTGTGPEGRWKRGCVSKRGKMASLGRAIGVGGPWAADASSKRISLTPKPRRSSVGGWRGGEAGGGKGLAGSNDDEEEERRRQAQNQLQEGMLLRGLVNRIAASAPPLRPPRTWGRLLIERAPGLFNQS